MANRPCLNCGTLTPNTRCPTCTQQHRGTTTQRGYGAAWARLSKQIIERDGGICQWCGRLATTTDHLIPKAMGGLDHEENLVAACRSCNSKRTAQTRRSEA